MREWWKQWHLGGIRKGLQHQGIPRHHQRRWREEKCHQCFECEKSFCVIDSHPASEGPHGETSPISAAKCSKAFNRRPHSPPAHTRAKPTLGILQAQPEWHTPSTRSSTPERSSIAASVGKPSSNPHATGPEESHSGKKPFKWAYSRHAHTAPSSQTPEESMRQAFWVARYPKSFIRLSSIKTQNSTGEAYQWGCRPSAPCAAPQHQDPLVRSPYVSGVWRGFYQGPHFTSQAESHQEGPMSQDVPEEHFNKSLLHSGPWPGLTFRWSPSG